MILLNRMPSLGLIACLLGAPLCAQVPEDMGPYPVGMRSVSFQHPLASAITVTADIYYPALSSGNNTPPDQAGGPYPFSSFLHGYFAPPSFYDELITHIASYGFVVAAVSTQTGLFQSIIAEAHDAHALMHWCDERNLISGHFLEGMLLPGPWSAVGHSNGAAAIFDLLAWEPRVQTIASTEGYWYGQPTVGQFQGSLLSVGSSEDALAPFSSNARRYYNEAQNARRRVWALIEGGAHNGSLDFPFGGSSLSHATQHRLHLRLITGFLRGEVQRDENTYYHLVGSGINGEPVTREGDCAQPILWIQPAAFPPGGQLLGVMGRALDDLRLFQASAGSGMWSSHGSTGGGGRLIHETVLTSIGSAEHIWVPHPGLDSVRFVADCSTSGAPWRRTRRVQLDLP
jgi:hypothetical protein